MPPGESNGTDLTSSEYLTFGGLAVVEGVMMRSPNHYSVACRAPNGKIVVKTEALTQTWIGKQQWLKKPLLRGTLALLDTMALGNRAMNWAAEVQTAPKYSVAGESTDPAQVVKPVSKTVENGLIVGAIVAGLLIQFVVFRATPEFIAEYVVRFASGSLAINKHLIGTNYLAEVIKVVMFIGFLAIISRFPSMVELFRYHGAEHKAINTIEAHEALNIENCRRQTRLHPRCGTNFLIIVTVVAFLIFPAIPRDLFVPANSPAWKIALSRVPLQLVVLPLIAGISYEIIRAAGKAKNKAWVNLILKPGLLTQLITTAEPETKHMEVAVASLKSVIKAEDAGHLTNSEDWESEHETPFV